MKMIGILGIVAAALAAGAADVQVSDLTGGAKTSEFKLYGKNRVANASFPVTALPAGLAGETLVSAPRGAANQAGAAYSVSIDRPAKVYLLVQDRGKPAIPEGWTKVPATVCWGDNYTDTVYLKEFDAPGKVEVPAHDGKQQNNFGIPSALVITDRDKETVSSPATESRLLPKSRMRVVRSGFAFVEFPAFLKDLPLISAPRGASDKPGASYSFTLKKPAKLYLLIQDRGTPAIPEGWTREEGKVTWTVGPNKQTDSIYSKEFPAGTVEIPAHNGKQGNAYGVPNAAVIQYK
ncbi:MAG: hypothetical protein HPZ91_10310 [Lentisphaeria bacterium]|nr:hypothetical protein [Lentisphaeria bacterium]